MCNCTKNRTAAAQKPKPVTVAFPDGTKKSYESDTAARVAAAQRGGRVLVG